MKNAIKVALINGSLDSIRSSYQAELERRNYVTGTVATHLRILGRLFAAMEERGIRLDALTPDVAVGLVQQIEWRGGVQTNAISVVRRFTAYLAAIGLTQPAALSESELARAALRREYEEYLCRQRGLNEGTIYYRWRFADRFLAFRFGESVMDLAAITPADVVDFLQLLTNQKAPFRDSSPAFHLRSFFQYLFKERLTGSNLSLCIPSVAVQQRDARLPRHLTPEQVEAVLSATRVDAERGRRNHAMVLLLARLGLRAPEVVAIQLDDVDWRAGELVVRGKGQLHDRVPLSSEIGAALADYIRHDRVSKSRALFVGIRAPNNPFKSGRVLNKILKPAFAHAGVALPAPHLGSRVLRHSLATNLIRQGASLDEVADMLRHRSRANTLIYAKLDIEGLRSVAQAWPVPGDAQ